MLRICLFLQLQCEEVAILPRGSFASTCHYHGQPTNSVPRLTVCFGFTARSRQNTRSGNKNFICNNVNVIVVAPPATSISIHSSSNASRNNNANNLSAQSLCNQLPSSFFPDIKIACERFIFTRRYHNIIDSPRLQNDINQNPSPANHRFTSLA